MKASTAALCSDGAELPDAALNPITSLGPALALVESYLFDGWA